MLALILKSYEYVGEIHGCLNMEADTTNLTKINQNMLKVTGIRGLHRWTGDQSNKFVSTRPCQILSNIGMFMETQERELKDLGSESQGCGLGYQVLYG